MALVLIQDQLAIFKSVNQKQQISSKWIAKETGKSHRNVLRDVRAYFDAYHTGKRSEGALEEAHQKTNALFTPSKALNGSTSELMLSQGFVEVLLRNYNAKHLISSNNVAKQISDETPNEFKDRINNSLFDILGKQDN